MSASQPHTVIEEIHIVFGACLRAMIVSQAIRQRVNEVAATVTHWARVLATTKS